MHGKMQVMIGSEDLAVWGQVTNVLESRGLGLTRFRSVKEACRALSRENVLVVFCENQLIDGTYEDLLKAARQVRSRTRIVVASSKSNWTDPSTYLRVKDLGAFDVLRESYGPKDVEWVVIYAIRDEESVRAAAAWHGRLRNDSQNLHTEESPASYPAE
jgi:DNA-binding NtrC family response regulator